MEHEPTFQDLANMDRSLKEFLFEHKEIMWSAQ